MGFRWRTHTHKETQQQSVPLPLIDAGYLQCNSRGYLLELLALSINSLFKSHKLVAIKLSIIQITNGMI
ncbi:hypothetical protein C5167_044173 [Papaver somniferum]|uniref:Uncharacterized protein n=1 Tax=Papaver somniferum TaxID=3469 RepID=A0A4Y7L7W4_PAPSO|nr:hypothetical protein C5167_044173 [Papaver somniferum]